MKELMDEIKKLEEENDECSLNSFSHPEYMAGYRNGLHVAYSKLWIYGAREIIKNMK